MKYQVRPGTRAGFSEIEFEGKPGPEVREALKAQGFRWAPSSQCWYGKSDKLPAMFREGATGAVPATAATEGKRPWNTCPTCKRPGSLTAYEARRGYQCYDCTRYEEGNGGPESPASLYAMELEERRKAAEKAAPPAPVVAPKEPEAPAAPAPAPKAEPAPEVAALAAQVAELQALIARLTAAPAPVAAPPVAVVAAPVVAEQPPAPAPAPAPKKRAAKIDSASGAPIGAAPVW